MKQRRRIGSLAGCALALAVAVPCNAQYKIFSWESFEGEGKSVPQSLRFAHYGSSACIKPVDFSSIGTMPGMTTPATVAENGLRGVIFTPDKGRPHLSLMNKTFLNRTNLGDDGSALVQADFYVPAQGEPCPNFAMVANHVDPTSEKAPYRFYRFGMLGDRIYFSFSNGGTEPEIYQEQTKSKKLEFERPGWHRFQIIFYGQDKIYCAIDGQMTSFSPIEDATLTNLSPGIMVTNRADFEGAVAYADNLSIQWSPYKEPQLPQSPWTPNAETARAGGSVGTNSKLIEGDSSLGWFRDAGQAWQAAQDANKPILALFFVPERDGYTHLVDICPNDGQAREWLTSFVPLRIDINQLGGGRTAEQFNIYRVPVLMVMGTDGEEKGRLIIQDDKTTWDEVLALKP